MSPNIPDAAHLARGAVLEAAMGDDRIKNEVDDVDCRCGCVTPSMPFFRAYSVAASPLSLRHNRLAFGVPSTHFGLMSTTGDDDSVERSRGAALEALRGPLTGYFRRRVRQQDDVPDLVQEVYLRLSNRDASTEIENLTGYVFQVASSVLTDRQRRRVVRHQDAHIELDSERIGETDLTPDRVLAGRDALKAVLAVVDRMPERTRTIFVLRRLEGMRFLEIASRLGLSVSAVEKHMLRALEQLAALGDVR